MEDRHIIWSNENLDLDDWREDLQEQYPDCSEDELYRIMCETNADYLSDERVNLNIQLSQPILVIADLGLWNGRRMGYKEIPSGNIRDCLSGGYDYTTQGRCFRISKGPAKREAIREHRHKSRCYEDHETPR